MISRTSASAAEPPPVRLSLVPAAPVDTLPTWSYDRVVTFSFEPALLALTSKLYWPSGGRRALVGLAVPAQRQRAGLLRAEVELAHDIAGAVADRDGHRVGRARQVHAQHRLAVGQVGGAAGDQHAVADQAGGLQRLAGLVAVLERAHGGVELVDAGHGGELGQLAGDLRIVERVQRVLVLHLRDQQLHEAVLGRAGAVGRGGCRGLAGVHRIQQRG